MSISEWAECGTSLSQTRNLQETKAYYEAAYNCYGGGNHDLDFYDRNGLSNTTARQLV